MRYQSLNAVKSLLVVVVLTSVMGVAAKTKYESPKLNYQTTSSSKTAKWKLVETIAVPVDGKVIKSKTALKQGESYKIRASGIATFSAAAGGQVDAEYGDFTRKNLLMDHCSYSAANTDIGLSIDDKTGAKTKRPRWGQYNELHEYSTYMIGAGLPIALNFRDCDYSDNQGSLRIEIFAEQALTLDLSLINSLQALIDQVPTYENTNHTECPNVDLAKAKALALELEKTHALLSVYKTLTQQGEDNERRQNNPAVEPTYREATSVVSTARNKVETTQKGFFRLMQGQMYPEPYPVRFSKTASEEPIDVMRHLDLAELQPLITSLQSAIQNFTVGAPVKSQVAMAKRDIQPGETIQLSFSASPCLAQDAWVGMVPSETQHGSAAVNDQRKFGQKQFIDRRRTGTMTFTAPNEPGSYDVRLNDSNRNGMEVASLTFRIGGAVAGIQSLKNLKSIVLSEQTFGITEVTFAPNARELTTRLPGSLSKSNSDFSFYEDEYYDVFYSNADGSFNPNGMFITIEGVWRQEGVTELGGGMNINEVGLHFGGPTPKVQYADYVASFQLGSICDTSKDNHCIPNSQSRAVDQDLETFPRFGQTSERNLSERFRLTIGFKKMK